MTIIEKGILLKTQATWKSWGEKIKIIQQSENDRVFVYHISSRPLWPLTITDYGKNFENINRIKQIVSHHA